MKKRKRGSGCVTPDGYLQHFVEGKYKLAHTMIAEKALGHQLPRGAQVHHVDGDRLNNSNSNLVICPSIAYHKLLHRRQEAMMACGNPNLRRCWICNTYADQSALQKNGRGFVHRPCMKKYAKVWYSKFKTK